MRISYLLLVSVAIILNIFLFFGLSMIPLFWDEATYLILAKNITTAGISPSLAYGQFPLVNYFHWLILKPFPYGDWLIIGRILSALFTSLSAALIFLIGRKLFGIWAGIWSVLLYALSPMIVIQSRLISLEPIYQFIILISVYQMLKLTVADSELLYVTIKSHFLFLLAFLVKPIALSAYPFLAIGPFFTRKRMSYLPFYLLIPVLTVFLALAIFMPTLSNFPAVVTKDSLFSGAFFSSFRLNFFRSLWWVRQDIGLLLPSFFVFFLYFFRRNKLACWIAIWLLGTYLIPIFTMQGGRFYPRHLYGMVPPLVLAAGALVGKFRRLSLVLLLPILVLFLPGNIKKIVNPKLANWTIEEKMQYFESYSSGQGLKEAVVFINSIKNSDKNLLFTEDYSLMTWGLVNQYPVAAQLRLFDFQFRNPKTIIQNIRNSCLKRECLLLLYRNSKEILPTDFYPIFRKFNGRDELILYRITADDRIISS